VFRPDRARSQSRATASEVSCDAALHALRPICAIYRWRSVAIAPRERDARARPWSRSISEGIRETIALEGDACVALLLAPPFACAPFCLRPLLLAPYE
jgi:hypothetical protein